MEDLPYLFRYSSPPHRRGRWYEQGTLKGPSKGAIVIRLTRDFSFGKVRSRAPGSWSDERIVRHGQVH